MQCRLLTRTFVTQIRKLLIHYSFPIAPMKINLKRLTIPRKLQIVEDNFKSAIPQFWDQAAFAHCISVDHHSSKNMSAGVVTIFRTQFGKIPYN